MSLSALIYVSSSYHTLLTLVSSQEQKTGLCKSRFIHAFSCSDCSSLRSSPVFLRLWHRCAPPQPQKKQWALWGRRSAATLASLRAATASKKQWALSLSETVFTHR